MNMDSEVNEKVRKTVDLIDRDRIRPEDPFFTARMMARFERDYARNGRIAEHPSFMLRFRPVVTVAALALGIFAGIFLGTRLSKGYDPLQADGRTSQIDQYAQEHFITEINGSFDEQLIGK